MSNTNWKNTVNQANQEAYAVPEGWSTEAEVAKDLGCAIPRIKDLLKPGLSNGLIEKQTFPIWCENLQGPRRITCYRPVPDHVPDGRTIRPRASVEERIKRCIKRYPKCTDREITKKVTGSRIALVRKVRAELQESNS